jgi:hypothetical protein
MKHELLNELQTLEQELKCANRLFFMALNRRSNAQKALKLYYEAHPEEVPIPMQTELNFA